MRLIYAAQLNEAIVSHISPSGPRSRTPVLPIPTTS